MFDISDMVFIAVFKAISAHIHHGNWETCRSKRQIWTLSAHQRIWVCCDDECDDDAGDIGDDDEWDPHVHMSSIKSRHINIRHAACLCLSSFFVHFHSHHSFIFSSIFDIYIPVDTVHPFILILQPFVHMQSTVPVKSQIFIQCFLFIFIIFYRKY